MKRYIHSNVMYTDTNALSRAAAREILKKYSPEQIKLVQKCNDDMNAEISKQFEEDWDPEMCPISLNAIKTDWMIEAIEDDLLEEDEFEELLSAIDVLDSEEANAWA